MQYGNSQSKPNSILEQQPYIAALPEKAIEAPLLPQEFDRMHGAVSDLEGQLDWLIQKIQPICQCVTVPSTGASGETSLQAPPSELRQLLINLRARIDGMTRRISEVKYTIEV